MWPSNSGGNSPGARGTAAGRSWLSAYDEAATIASRRKRFRPGASMTRQTVLPCLSWNGSDGRLLPSVRASKITAWSRVARGFTFNSSEGLPVTS